MSELLKKIKAADKKNLLPVEVPEWELTVYIKNMTVGERDSFDREIFTAKKKGDDLIADFRSKILARTLCDESGKPLCEASEFEQLTGLSAKPMEMLFEQAQKHNGIAKDDVEELAKN